MPKDAEKNSASHWLYKKTPPLASESSDSIQSTLVNEPEKRGLQFESLSYRHKHFKQNCSDHKRTAGSGN